MSRSCFKLRQHSPVAGARLRRFVPELRLLLGRGLGQTPLELFFGLGQRGGRIGMHGHGRVAQHRLGPGRGNRHMPWLAGLWIDHRILEVPEMALHRFVKHFVVADGRLQERVPVDQPLAAINFAVLEQLEKGLAHGPGADRIQRESRPLPVAATAHLLQLADDARFVVLLPLPDAFDEPLAAQLVPAELLFAQQPPLDDRLRGDAGMIGARHPQRLEALHPLLPDEDVLQRVVQRVAQVQGPGDVRRRDDDRVRLLRRVRLAMEIALLLPRTDTTAAWAAA